MKQEVRESIVKMGESNYKKFAASLLPGTEHVLGVRLPLLRELAKKIAKGNWREELSQGEDYYFEEIMLRGMIIGYADAGLEESMAYITSFVPCIDNWSVCDSFCTSLKVIQKNREEAWEYLVPYLNSVREFEVRFGLIVLLDYYIKCDESGKSISRNRRVTLEDVKNSSEKKGRYIDDILSVLNREYNQGYYAQMAAAWTTAEAFCTFPRQTMKVLADNHMDSFTFKKSIQKICESRIPEQEVKDLLKTLRN